VTHMTPRTDPPIVSVVIPCYRAAGFVADAIDSVLAQEGVPREVLVVDDGSPDGPELEAIALRYADAPAPVRLLKEPHRGLAATRNAGIEGARGPWLAFLDADDCWMPGFLAAQLALAEREQADVVYCDAVFFGGSEKDGATVMTWHPSERPVTLAAVLAERCLPVMSTIVARTDAVRRVGGFDPDLAWGEDFELWARMLDDGACFAWSSDVRVRRRIHADNLSHDTLRMALGQVAVIERYADRVDRAAPLAPAIQRRRRRLDAVIHLSRARTALQSQDSATARSELWGVVRAGGSAKHWAAALALTVAPGLAAGLLKRRV